MDRKEIKVLDYEKYLIKQGLKPLKFEEIGRNQSAYTQMTISVLSIYEDGTQMLYQFFYWIILSHFEPESRLSSYSFNQLI